MPRMRRPHGENGDIPLPRKRESLPGRLLLRRSFTPIALQLNLNLPPGGRRAIRERKPKGKTVGQHGG